MGFAEGRRAKCGREGIDSIPVVFGEISFQLVFVTYPPLLSCIRQSNDPHLEVGSLHNLSCVAALYLPSM
eukprot:1391178-Karenia_brevis.AAC.1